MRLNGKKVPGMVVVPLPGTACLSRRPLKHRLTSYFQTLPNLALSEWAILLQCSPKTNLFPDLHVTLSSSNINLHPSALHTTGRATGRYNQTLRDRHFRVSPLSDFPPRPILYLENFRGGNDGRAEIKLRKI